MLEEAALSRPPGALLTSGIPHKWCGIMISTGGVVMVQDSGLVVWTRLEGSLDFSSGVATFDGPRR